jgi:hypothetical protein
MIAALVFLGGCATANRDSAPAVAKPAPAPLTVASSAKAPQDPHLVTAARYARENGYHQETRHGDLFWCRHVAPLGSRLEEKQCLTSDGMIQAAEISEQNRATFQQSQMCQGANCTIK